MAENVSAGGGRRRRGAEAAGETPENEPPRAAANVATEEDMQRAFAVYKNAEVSYDAFLATQRAEKTAAKSIRDKALTDAVAITASRGITKKTMRKIYERSLLDADELRAEVKAEVWGMRAAGLPVGSQLAFFDDEFVGNDAALRQAYSKGRDAYVEKRSDSDNPFHPSSEPGQRWLAGFNDAQADVVRAMAPKTH